MSYITEEAGFSAERLKRIGTFMQTYIDRNDLAGMTYSIARQGQTVCEEALGMMDIEAHKPMQVDAIFRIASMSKPITSVAAMMLYEEGHFNLNTPVSNFIPGFENMKVYAGEGENGDGPNVVDLERPVTFRHLFTHTSGLSYGGNPNDPIDRLIQAGQKELAIKAGEFTTKTLADEMVKVPLASQPGTRWRYGMNIEILGHIVEIISGKTLAEFLQERLFGPLGMVDTDFYVPSEKCDRVAALYGHTPDQTGLHRMDAKVPTEQPSFQSGGGGLHSTLGDYARFLQMLVNRGEFNGVRLLSPRTVAMYSTNYAPWQALPYGFPPHGFTFYNYHPEEDRYHAGYGFSLGTRVLLDPSKTGMDGNEGEFGWDGAFNTYFWVDPTLDLYGVIMLQHYPNAYYPVAQQFKQLTYQAMIV